MTSVDIEIALVGLVAMLEPATLVSSALVLVIGDHPKRTGFWFYVGGLGATLLVGVLAAFVLGNAGSVSPGAGPKTWVSVFNLVAGLLAAAYVAWTLRHPADPRKTAATVGRMDRLAKAPILTIVVSGAVLANAGVFMVVALKSISQLNPSTLQYILDWLLFSLASMLPLGIALLLLSAAPDWTAPKLSTARAWIERHARTIALVIVGALAVSLIREGIAGLTS
jgi:hypothetical protein